MGQLAAAEPPNAATDARIDPQVRAFLETLKRALVDNGWFGALARPIKIASELS